MRVIGDINGALAGDPKILEVTQNPAFGELVPLNGKFVVPIVEGATIEVDDTSYIMPVDGGDVYSQSYAQLLAMYPMYEYIYFNPLVDSADLLVFDLAPTTTWTDGFGNAHPTKAQVGRPSIPPFGMVPGGVALLEANHKVGPPRWGMLMTNKIDISFQTAGAGADEFMVYWKMFEYETSDDVLASYGKLAGQNTPAIRSIKEIDQENENYKIYLSRDDGITWERVFRLVPMAFPTTGTDIRIVFTNESDHNKPFLSTFAFMF